MLELIVAVTFAIFVWWFSTGAILYLDNLARATFRWSLIIFGGITAGALVCLSKLSNQLTVSGAYAGFVCAICVWGWVELSFLTGIVTGPNKTPWRPPPAPLAPLAPLVSQVGQSGLKFLRLKMALGALLYHELLIAFFGLVIFFLTYDKHNQVAMATYLVLWVMRSSSKVNLFLGVRNWSAEFLPDHLRYMKSFFRQRAMNWLFPISVTVSLVCLYQLSIEAFAPQTTVEQKTGLILVGALLALGLLEHLLMVMPFTANAIWKWALPKRGTVTPQNISSITKITKEVR
jgi:putative photosynthetic complex assembly protein 2